MTDAHLTAPTRFVDTNGDRFASRRWGNTTTGQPPLFFLQHFRGGMGHWDPLMTDGLAAGHDEELVVGGDFVEVLWFQGFTEYLQPSK